jgi:epidermal growth factor receptor substrate 15
MFQSNVFQSNIIQHGAAAAVPTAYSAAETESAIPSDACDLKVVSASALANEQVTPSDANKSAAIIKRDATESTTASESNTAGKKTVGAIVEGAGGSPTLRSGFPVVNEWSGTTDGSGYHTTTFNALASDRIYLFVEYDLLAGTPSSTMLNPPTSGNLTWSFVNNALNAGADAPEVWLFTAVAATNLTGEVVRSGVPFKSRASVYIFDGASSTLGQVTVNTGTATAPTVSANVTGAGSVVLTSTIINNRAPTPTPPTLVSGNTATLQSADNNDWAYVTESVSNTTTSSSPVSVGISAPTTQGWSLVAVEILPAGTSAVPTDVQDSTVSSPAGGVLYNTDSQSEFTFGLGDITLDGTWLDGGSNAGSSRSTTSVSISTSGANRLIVALCGLGSTNGNNPISSVSGGGLTWTKRIGSVGSATGTNWNYAEIWTAPAPAQLTTQSITLTLTGADTGAIQFTVGALTGHNIASPIGASGTNTGTGATRYNADVSVTATASNSWLLGVWDSPAGPVSAGTNFTALANTTYFYQHNDVTGQNNGATGRLTSPTSGAGSVTFGSSTIAAYLAGNTDMGAVGLEILAAGTASGLVDTQAGAQAIKSIETESSTGSDVQDFKATKASLQTEFSTPAEDSIGKNAVGVIETEFSTLAEDSVGRNKVGLIETESSTPSDTADSSAIKKSDELEFGSPSVIEDATVTKKAGTLYNTDAQSESVTPSDSDADTDVELAIEAANIATPSEDQIACNSITSGQVEFNVTASEDERGSSALRAIYVDNSTASEVQASAIVTIGAELEYVTPSDVSSASVAAPGIQLDYTTASDANTLALFVAAIASENATGSESEDKATRLAGAQSDSSSGDEQEVARPSISTAYLDYSTPSSAETLALHSSGAVLDYAQPDEASTGVDSETNLVQEQAIAVDSEVDTQALISNEAESVQPADAVAAAVRFAGELNEPAFPGEFSDSAKRTNSAETNSVGSFDVDALLLNAGSIQTDSASGYDVLDVRSVLSSGQTDSATPADANQVEPASNSFAVTEAISAVDAIVDTGISVAAQSDTSTASDANTALSSIRTIQSDSVSTSDDNTATKSVAGILSDTTTASVDERASSKLYSLYSDSAQSPADATDSGQRILRDQTDYVQPQDGFASNTFVSINNTEAASANDAFASNAVSFDTVTEAATANDSLGEAGNNDATITEPVPVTVVLSNTQKATGFESNAVSSSATQSTTVSSPYAISDVATGSDTSNGARSTVGATSESASGDEASTVARVVTASLSESSSGSDASSTHQAFVITYPSNANAAAIADPAGEKTGNINENLTLALNNTVSQRLVSVDSEPATPSDVVSSANKINVNDSASSAPSDEYNRLVVYGAASQEYVTPADAEACRVVSAISHAANANTDVTLQQSSSVSTHSTDNATASSTQDATSVTSQSLTDAAAAVDTLISGGSTSASEVEYVTSYDAQDILCSFVELVTESASANDATDSIKGFFEDITESASANDAASSTGDVFVEQPHETASASDATTTTISAVNSFSYDLTLSFAVFKSLPTQDDVTESASCADALNEYHICAQNVLEDAHGSDFLDDGKLYEDILSYANTTALSISDTHALVATLSDSVQPSSTATNKSAFAEQASFASASSSSYANKAAFAAQEISAATGADAANIDSASVLSITYANTAAAALSQQLALASTEVDSQSANDAAALHVITTNNISESSFADDSLSVSRILAATSVTESSTAASTLASPYINNIGASESSSANDAITSRYVSTDNITETSSGSDATDYIYGIYYSVTEVASGADAFTSHKDVTLAVDENLTSADFVTTGSLKDSALLADGVAAFTLSQVQIQFTSYLESGSSTDSPSVSFISVAKYTDSTQPVDLDSSTIDIVRTVSENGSLSDVAVCRYVFNESITVIASAIDSTASIHTQTQYTIETSSSTDSVTNNAVFVNSGAESAIAGDASNGDSGSVFSISEQLSAADVMSALPLYLENVSEHISSTETTSTVHTSVTYISETASGVDTTLAGNLINASTHDIGNATDTPAQLFSINNILGEQATAIDSLATTFIDVNNITEAASAVQTVNGSIDIHTPYDVTLDPFIDITVSGFTLNAHFFDTHERISCDDSLVCTQVVSSNEAEQQITSDNSVNLIDTTIIFNSNASLSAYVYASAFNKNTGRPVVTVAPVQTVSEPDNIVVTDEDEE